MCSPEFHRDHMAHRPGVLTSSRKCAGDRGPAVRIGCQPFGCLAQRLGPAVGQAHHRKQAAGGHATPPHRSVRGPDTPRRSRIRAVPSARLDIPANPEDGLGDPAEQSTRHDDTVDRRSRDHDGGRRPRPRPCCSCCCCCCCCCTPSSASVDGAHVLGRTRQRCSHLAGREHRGGEAPADDPGVLRPAPLARIHNQAALPECDPVRPPGRTQMFSPSFTAKGRRSTCRRSMPLSTQVERSTRDEALGDPTPGVGFDLDRQLVELVARRRRPDDQSLSPDPSTRLNTRSPRRASASFRAAASTRCIVSTFCRMGSSPR